MHPHLMLLEIYGYTAIAAAQKAAAVITIELDPGSLEMARANPWPQELFNHPGISHIAGDSSEEIAKLPDEYFYIIVHDPPSLSLTGDLYAGVHNIITIGWTGVICSDPAMCSVSIRPERFSYQSIRKSGEFTINLTTASMAKAVDWCGVKNRLSSR